MRSDWHYLSLIKSLASFASLLHDWGKATELFQEKLLPHSKNKCKGDPIRHEWISVLLLNAFIGDDDDVTWLTRLSHGQLDERLLKERLEESPNVSLGNLPPTAQLVVWLIVSHHRLPLPTDTRIYQTETSDSLAKMLNRIQKEWGYENRYDEKVYQRRLKKCFSFPYGLLSSAKEWMGELTYCTKQLLTEQQNIQICIENGSYRVALNYARLCLMLGDHFYSSQPADEKLKKTTALYANTDRQTRELKQPLDEHLVGVAHHASHIAQLLPDFELELPIAENVESLWNPSPEKFHWQDKAVKKIQKYRSDLKEKQGFFGVNMASTGMGKTFANAKIMQSLSVDQKSLRFTLALGLRSLTLQTGREYRERVGLSGSELAVQIGSRAVMELDQINTEKFKENAPESFGSESLEPLLENDVDHDCSIPEEGLATVLTTERDKAFLYAPVLTCTIDHIMAATETKRGGRYILPTLRLMSSDLVIDEIDDFTDTDLIAIGRLIHLAGMLGRKVMISSATIPPYMAEGYFNAYRAGWQLYCLTSDAEPAIGCSWIDEYTTEIDTINVDSLQTAVLSYRKTHADFIVERLKELKREPAKRKAELAFCESILDQYKNKQQQMTDVLDNKQTAYFKTMYDQAWSMHKTHYHKDRTTNIKVSFGVIRVANISPCVALSQYLLERDYPSNAQVRVMAYHSQQVLLLRSEQERHLDEVLKRKEKKGEQPLAYSNAIIRGHLDDIAEHQSEVKNVLFILVATPVEEVGRDHDFDWAVVEPSSYRSIVQLAGRVRRHREGEVSGPNMSLMQYNLKGMRYAQHDEEKVFIKPGFEGKIRLKHKSINKLVDVEKLAERVDAGPRIQQPKHILASSIYNAVYADSLADLEHMMTWYWLANYKAIGAGQLSGWLSETWWLSALPQVLAPFRNGNNNLKVFLVCDLKKGETYFIEKDISGSPVRRENNIQHKTLGKKATSSLWLQRDFERSCKQLAIDKNITPYLASLRYGELTFRFDEKKQYIYNDQLGLVTKG